MRNAIQTVVITAIFIFLISTPIYCFYYIVVDSSSDFAYSSIALDSQSFPHIAYVDNTFTTLDLKYAYWTGTEWHIQTIDSEGDIFNCSLALDSQGDPHIAFYDDINESIKYAHLVGGNWDIQSIDENCRVYDSIPRPEIVIDTADYPHITYANEALGVMKYAKWNGSEWEIQDVENVNYMPYGHAPSLCLDSLNLPHISYIDHLSEWSCGLKYAKFSGTDWEIQRIDSEMEETISTSIAIDSDDNPHIAYDFNASPVGHYAKYAKWNGSEWVIEILEDGYWTAGERIAIDSDDSPHIIYESTEFTYPYNYYYKFRYARKPGSEWLYETIAEGDGYGVVGDLALSEDNNPHVSYCDYDDQSLIYAWEGSGIYVDLLSFTAQPSHSAIILSWQIETTEGEQITGFNLYRRTLAPDGDDIHHPLDESRDQLWEQLNDSLITGQNPYAYTNTTVEPSKAYEYKLEVVLADQSAQTLGTTQAITGVTTSFAILELYPNPANNYLKLLLSVPDAGLVTLELYDLTGRLVMCREIDVSEPSDTEAVVDVSGLASGVYTLRASFGKAQVSALAVIAR